MLVLSRCRLVQCGWKGDGGSGLGSINMIGREVGQLGIGEGNISQSPLQYCGRELRKEWPAIFKFISGL